MSQHGPRGGTTSVLDSNLQSIVNMAFISCTFLTCTYVCLCQYEVFHKDHDCSFHIFGFASFWRTVDHTRVDHYTFCVFSCGDIFSTVRSTAGALVFNLSLF